MKNFLIFGIETIVLLKFKDNLIDLVIVNNLSEDIKNLEVVYTEKNFTRLLKKDFKNLIVKSLPELTDFKKYFEIVVYLLNTKKMTITKKSWINSLVMDINNPLYRGFSYLGYFHNTTDWQNISFK